MDGRNFLYMNEGGGVGSGVFVGGGEVGGGLVGGGVLPPHSGASGPRTELLPATFSAP